MMTPDYPASERRREIDASSSSAETGTTKKEARYRSRGGLGVCQCGVGMVVVLQSPPHHLVETQNPQRHRVEEAKHPRESCVSLAQSLHGVC